MRPPFISPFRSVITVGSVDRLGKLLRVDDITRGPFRRRGVCIQRALASRHIATISTAMQHHTISIRVRYPECDPMGYLHHSVYLQYFEMGRVELLRSLGFSYADLERRGIFFVVVKVDVRYKAPARYDEELTLITRVEKQTHVRYDHAYELRRGETVLAVATTTIACVDREGHVIQIPEEMREEEE